MMAGNSGLGESIQSNPWMTALQAATVGGYPKKLGGGHASRPIEDFGATCWYFAQKLTDEMEAAGKPVVPIGLTDTAIGGQRIEEYNVNVSTRRLGNGSYRCLYDNARKCARRTRPSTPATSSSGPATPSQAVEIGTVTCMRQ